MIFQIPSAPPKYDMKDQIEMRRAIQLGLDAVTAGQSGGATGGTAGVGTAGFIPVWGSNNTLGNSLFRIDAGALLPVADVVHDIGSPTARLRDVYAKGTVRAGQLIVGSQELISTGIELGNDMAAGTTPFLDFHFGIGSANDFSGRLISRAQNNLGVEFVDQTAGKFLVAGYALQRPTTYGGLRLPDVTSGWSGIEFTSPGINFLVDARYQGMHKAAGWIWQFDNGTLSVGTVPLARLGTGDFISSGHNFPQSVSFSGWLPMNRFGVHVGVTGGAGTIYSRDYPNALWKPLNIYGSSISLVAQAGDVTVPLGRLVVTGDIITAGYVVPVVQWGVEAPTGLPPRDGALYVEYQP